MLRPNALIAAPFLTAYVMFPERYSWKRAAVLFLPGLIVGYALIHVVYYEMLNARHQTPLHQIYVFDLGGITHFTGANQFPVQWTAAQTALLTTQCYDPVRGTATGPLNRARS